MFNNGISQEPEMSTKEFVHARRLAVESAQVTAMKDQRIGIRVPTDLKALLTQIANKEGRSLAQVCELLLRGGIQAYEREGTKYLHRILERHKDSD
jgi:hypothetical protein